jgi:hypothetical protein
MMKFQRQGCVLSNDYEELSIREVKPLDILAFVLVSLSAKRETSGHVTVGDTNAYATARMR